MKRVFALLPLSLLACDIHVPVDEIKIPPIENNTTIVVQLSDGGVINEHLAAPDAAQESTEPPCVYQHFPDYYPYGAFVLGCTGEVDTTTDFVCCTWVFPEREQACEERWCRDKKNECGWDLNGWHCYNY